MRSPDYPNPDSRIDHVYRTRIKEDVVARVIHSPRPRLLEEAQKGRTFSRRVRDRLEPARERTRLTVEESASSGWLGWPPARRPDVRGRRRRSLERLRETAERG